MVQLASKRGADVTGVASPTKHAAVLDAGALDVLARDDLPSPANYDRVIDVVGGDAWPHLIAALKPGGHYATSGAIAGPLVQADLREIYLRDITIHGCTFTPLSVFARLVEMMISGQIKPLVSKTYPLGDIATAQADFVAKRYPGKLVLIPPVPI